MEEDAVMISGVVPSSLTPFDPAHRVELVAFEAHVRRMADAGVNAIIVASTLGEAPTLSAGEKLALVECAAAAVPDRLPVIAALVGSGRDEDAVYLRSLRERGARALLLFPPTLYRPGERELADHVLRAIAESGLPTLVFNKPASFGCDFSPRVAARVEREAGWIGVKEAAELTSRIAEWKRRYGSRCTVLAGDELVWEALGLGADGFVAGLGNAVPAECVAFFDAFAGGRLDEALAAYRRLAPVLQLDVSPRLVQDIKAATAALADFPETVRPPRHALDHESRAQVIELIRRFIALPR
jgi:1-pyrroline-4-hydroxy-2-carboxylate deaminase